MGNANFHPRNERPIPDTETRGRSVANLRELVKRIDRHIADLDELNARLDAEYESSLLGAYGRSRRFLHWERSAHRKNTRLLYSYLFPQTPV